MVVSFNSPPGAAAVGQANRARSGSKGRSQFFQLCPIPQIRVLHNKSSSQRNQSCSNEFVELDNWSATRKDGDGDSEFLGVTAVYARVETGISHRGETARNIRERTGFLHRGRSVRNTRVSRHFG
jgi:hypothetical protein